MEKLNNRCSFINLLFGQQSKNSSFLTASTNFQTAPYSHYCLRGSVCHPLILKVVHRPGHHISCLCHTASFLEACEEWSRGWQSRMLCSKYSCQGGNTSEDNKAADPLFFSHSSVLGLKMCWKLSVAKVKVFKYLILNVSMRNGLSTTTYLHISSCITWLLWEHAHT